MGCLGAAGRSVRSRPRRRSGVPRSAARRGLLGAVRRERCAGSGRATDGRGRPARRLDERLSGSAVVRHRPVPRRRGRAGRRVRRESRDRGAVHRDSQSRRRAGWCSDLGLSMRDARRCDRRSERAARPPLRLGTVPRPRRLGARHLRSGDRGARRLVRHEPSTRTGCGTTSRRSSSSKKRVESQPRSMVGTSSCSTTMSGAHRRSPRRVRCSTPCSRNGGAGE